MRSFIYCLLLLPLVLFAGQKGHRRIEFYHTFTLDPKNPATLNSYLTDVKNVLSEKNIDIVPSDLTGNLKADEVSYVVVWNWPKWMSDSALDKIPREKAILFMWEPPSYFKKMYDEKTLSHFKRIYTWDDDLVDNKRFFKFYYPELKPMRGDLPSFQEKKLLTFVFSNKKSKHPHQLYTERENVIKFFESNHSDDFEFYGQAWEKKGYKRYRGSPDNKMDTLKNYRFAICYESMGNVRGYITEKIFDCFAAGTVPIYLGATNIADYIPQNCFIDRTKFKDNEALYQFLKNMDQETYEQYLQNIREFLKTDKAQLFSMTMFHVIFLEAIRFP